MVSTEKNGNTALTRYRLGTLLVWIGVLAWVPFIILRASGLTLSLFWFLPFHLLGVIGGSRLRKTTRRELNLARTSRSRLRSMGHLLIFAGILVWVPYLYLKLFTQTPVDVSQFLPFHLTGILSGVFLLLVNFYINQRDD